VSDLPSGVGRETMSSQAGAKDLAERLKRESHFYPDGRVLPPILDATTFSDLIAFLETSQEQGQDARRWIYVHLAKGELMNLFYEDREELSPVTGKVGTGSNKFLLAMNDEETVKGIRDALDYLETATQIKSVDSAESKE